MTQQLSWSRDGERLVLLGELDQDVLNPLWDARAEAMKGVTTIDLQGVTRLIPQASRCWFIWLNSVKSRARM